MTNDKEKDLEVADENNDADTNKIADEAQDNEQETSSKEKQEPTAEEKSELTAEEKLTKELDEQKDKYMRLAAEYDNFRKRSAKERLDISATTIGNTVSEILPVFDNFERALNAETTDEKYKSGVEMIFNQFGEALKKLGVEIIDPLGETFDPNIANAVNQIEDDKLGENEVAEVFQKGYKIGDKIIRYAMVVVANP